MIAVKLLGPASAFCVDFIVLQDQHRVSLADHARLTPSWSIIMGSQHRLRFRFHQEAIMALLERRWGQLLLLPLGGRDRLSEVSSGLHRAPVRVQALTGHIRWANAQRLAADVLPAVSQTAPKVHIGPLLGVRAGAPTAAQLGPMAFRVRVCLVVQLTAPLGDV